MDTLERKSGNDATFLNCFWRSIVFKTMSLLNGSDSGVLFIKTYFIYYATMMVVSALTSFAVEGFEFGFVLKLMVGMVFLAILTALCVFFVCFILNLFLADDFMRIVNVFTFSGVHNWFLDIFGRVYFKYKKYDEKISVNGIQLLNIIRNYVFNGENRLTIEEKEVISVMKEMFKTYLFLSVLWIFTFIAFIILLVRNIRALRKK